jgi:hypothetical protein
MSCFLYFRMGGMKMRIVIMFGDERRRRRLGRIGFWGKIIRYSSPSLHIPGRINELDSVEVVLMHLPFMALSECGVGPADTEVRADQ